MGLAPNVRSAPQLVDFSLSYGECSGYCTTVLTVQGSSLELTQKSTDETDPDLVFAGTAGGDLAEAVADAAAGLEPAMLLGVYGTPDARDEGAATMRLLHHTIVTEHRYSAPSPPAELAALHGLLMPVVEAWLDRGPIDGARFDLDD